ncbi:putative Rdx family selenoprotein [Bradyrhizobium sp. LM6.10]
MGVDDFDDGHRANQEEHDLRGGGDGLIKLTADQRVVARRERVDCPEHARAEQRRRALVHPDRMLERDRRIGEDEDCGECDQQGRITSSGVSD